MDAARWQRVRALLQEAVTLEPDERPSFLDRACPDADDRREVESLLAHYDPGGEFLEQGVGAVAAALLGPEGLAHGQSLGSYRIVRELGRGGMGVVYLAHDTTLDREVAIKMLPADASRDARRRERFRQEARAAAAVPHPGIAHVYALEQDSHGNSFLVSEYVAGHTLRAEIERGPVLPSEAVSTAVQIAEALGAAHARGVVHRDLKPENVMRTTEGAVKVLDFGLARLLSVGTDDTRARLTVTGAVIGTPAYMSPEQLRGAEAGPQADIFALGLLIHEMLTGRHAFGSAGRGTTALVHILERPPDHLPPSVSAELPGIEAVVRRCLEKDAAHRYQTMGEVVAALVGLAAPAVGSVDPAFRPRDARRDPGPGWSDLWWWRFHQVTVSAIHVAMIYPAWKLRGLPIPAWAHDLLLLAIVVAAALTTTLRLHGVFTARVQPGQLASARRRARPWLRRFDWLTTLALLAAAGASLMRGQVWFAALFVTVATSTTVAFLLIEPATTEAAFGPEAP